jgi:hypothetical protein
LARPRGYLKACPKAMPDARAFFKIAPNPKPNHALPLTLKTPPQKEINLIEKLDNSVSLLLKVIG